jgi:formylglycine-generating enzyme required for sulfatase activity
LGVLESLFVIWCLRVRSLVAANGRAGEILMHGRMSRRITSIVMMGVAGLTCPAEEKPVEAKAYPLWDGKESVAEYAKRVKMDTSITLDLGDGVKMEFVLIPAGKFVMGSPQNEKGRYLMFGQGLNEEPQHEVTIVKPFYMGRFEVTQEQYEKLIKENPNKFKGARNPVEMVSWDDAQAFCKKLNEKTGRPVRLPSKAEWEYACRAGSKTPFHPPRERRTNTLLTEEQRRRVAELIPSLGNDEYAVREKATRDLIAMGRGVLPILEGIKSDDREIQSRVESVRSIIQHADFGSVAWYSENSDEKPHPVGGKAPNEFGLYDMLGNVLEWVEDDWHKDYKGAPMDGRAWVENSRTGGHVVRGGSWNYNARNCRSASRHGCVPGCRSHVVGFRVVLLSLSPRTP